jgi:ribosome biogenesis GTPase
MKLSDHGWNEHWQNLFAPYAAEGMVAARVTAEHKSSYRVSTGDVELQGEVSGRLRHHAIRRSDSPAVGDFVALRRSETDSLAIIDAVLPRRTVFIRKAAGKGLEDQVVAANIDAVFIMTALDQDFNLRRLERYVTLVWEGGAQPIILLNKADVCDDRAPFLDDVNEIKFGVPVHVLSALTSEGLEALNQYLRPGFTVGFVGSSGVGKSTLLNTLLGREAQTTREVREDDHRGRHTTTHRQLFVRAEGGIIIDTPGMRELQLGNVHEGVQKTFSDIERLAMECRFSDCQHKNEPGCAVRAAVDRGELSAERLFSYDKLLKEMRHANLQFDEDAAREKKRQDKVANKAMKPFKAR